MKNKLIYYLSSALVISSLNSCSRKLTEEKAKELFAVCEKKEGFLKKQKISIPKEITKGLFRTKSEYEDFLPLIKILAKHNYIHVDSIKQDIGFMPLTKFIFTPTKRLEPFIISEVDQKGNYVMRIYEVIPKGINSIQEIPEYNIAKVSMNLKINCLIPEIAKDSTLYRTSLKHDITYKKTNNGWTLCN